MSLHSDNIGKIIEYVNCIRYYSLCGKYYAEHSDGDDNGDSETGNLEVKFYKIVKNDEPGELMYSLLANKHSNRLVKTDLLWFTKCGKTYFIFNEQDELKNSNNQLNFHYAENGNIVENCHTCSGVKLCSNDIIIDEDYSLSYMFVRDKEDKYDHFVSLEAMLNRPHFPTFFRYDIDSNGQSYPDIEIFCPFSFYNKEKNMICMNFDDVDTTEIENEFVPTIFYYTGADITNTFMNFTKNSGFL